MFTNLMLFSKHLAGLPLPEAARRVAALGIPALDLTVRKKGHVNPEQVETQLPEAAKILADAGLKIGMLTTDITTPLDPFTLKILATAASLGITHYKLGYYLYQGFGHLKEQRKKIAAHLHALANVNERFHLHAGFHNHSDDYIGANVSDILHVLGDIDPKHIGIYFDPAHATIEGGSQGWIMALDLIRDHITMLAVKDFRWVDGKHRYAGGRRNSVEFCPLAQGNTPWPQVLQYLAQLKFDGPISFHSEYQGPSSFQDLTSDQVLTQTASDLALFQQWSHSAVL